MTNTLIGVDIGTTNIKGVAFSLEGVQLASATTPTLTQYPRPGWAQYQPDDIWDGICTVLRQLTEQLSAEMEPASIAFSSMAESAIPVDAQGQPTYDSIAWFDHRTAPLAQWWQEQIGQEQTTQITGLPIHPMCGILKLLWIKENEPEAFARTQSWLNMADYAVYRLCGAQATDYSLASRTMALDLDRKCWSQSLLGQADLTESLLAELVPSGTLLGHVHAEAAAATGLPEGTAVCSGGHDHICGSFGLGLTEAGDALDSMGTAEGIVLILDKLNLSTDVTTRSIAQGIHVIPNRYYSMGGVTFSGGSVDWIRQILLGAMPEQSTTASFEKMVALASEVPAGSDGLFFLPHLRQANPPINDANARGAFIGITSDATTGHFARAVLEGVAYDYQRAFENMMDTFQVTPNRIYATGGGTRNPLWMAIKAQVCGQEINIPQVDEATCLGAAMLAGVGAGVYRDFSEAGQQIEFSMRDVPSDSAGHQFYRERYEQVYLKLYDALRDVHHVISGWE